MKNWVNAVLGVFALAASVAILNTPAAYGQDGESILALRASSSTVSKAHGDIKKHRAALAARAQSSSLETLEYRGFHIYLNRVSGGIFELQAFRMLTYGDAHVSSIFASQYQSSIEYVYSYDGKRRQIRRQHFLFPANSLTGWSDPENLLLLRRFDWKERFPSARCGTPVYTCEEFGREYLEATCFRDREAALRFAHRFINYVGGDRGL